MKSHKTTLILFIGFTLALTVATLLPSDSLPSGKLKFYDKVIHFVLFGLWSALLYFVEHFKGKRRPWNNYWYCVIVTGIYGFLIEVLQITLPVNRSYELFDLVADVLGALFFTAVASWISEKYFKSD